MIGYLQGTLLKRDKGRVLVLAGQVGYEVLLPGVVDATFDTREIGEEVSLYIYFHATEKNPKPVLIGFNEESQKEFFERFISVEAIGPVKAALALNQPVGKIAAAIEQRDAAFLRKLPGIGARTADRVVASLCGKVAAWAYETEQAAPAAAGESPGFARQVEEVLVKQLGHKPAEAREMIARALKADPSISTPEQLFDEVYRHQA
ncbi:MAG: Holliday junction DNA helicase RuvA [Deltaproteobacteria bacterium]|nr:Holliday junction DNA helicase RuvA [Deltaproteobacteria bacterium]